MSLLTALFPSRKLVPLPNDFFSGAVDVHSHILPGVDDGVPNEEEAVKALTFLGDLGYKQAVLTPHVMAEYEGNRREALQKRFDEFTQTASQLPISLSLAAEYMVDDAFTSHAAEGYLTMGRVKFVLTETSYYNVHPSHAQMLYHFSLEGYNPIIAHPERYQYASDRQYASWKRKGYCFQLNLLSLAGAYGEAAEEKALRFLDEEMYSFVGTDLHKVETFRHWLPKIQLKVKQIDRLHELLEHNHELVAPSKR